MKDWVLAHFHAGFVLVANVLHWLEVKTIFTDRTALYTLLGIIALYALLGVYTFFSQASLRSWAVALTALSIPLVLVITLRLTGGFAGTLDRNCTAYDNGHLKFTLYSLGYAYKYAENPSAGKWLVLTVYADRWPNEVHVCALDTRSAVAQELATRLLFAGGPQMKFNDVEGALSFTFRPSGKRENSGGMFELGGGSFNPSVTYHPERTGPLKPLPH